MGASLVTALYRARREDVTRIDGQKKARRKDVGLGSPFAVTHQGTRSGRKSGERQAARLEI
jgi:hypothetical protein